MKRRQKRASQKKKGKLQSMINQRERNLESFLCNGFQQIKVNLISYNLQIKGYSRLTGVEKFQIPGNPVNSQE